MAGFRTEISDETAGWVIDAASRFNVTRSEIVERALEHYLGHENEMRATFQRRQQQPAPEVDWAHAKETLRKAHCPFNDCPFAGDCPGDVCPL